MQLLKAALDDCSGLTILDLGGGTGLFARVAVDAGAALVDVVNISPAMLRVGQEEEYRLNRVGRIRWFEADGTKPLDCLALRLYDLVMSKYLIDHATTITELEAMSYNIVAHLKPGGRFVGARVGNPRAAGLLSGQYGATYKDHQNIPGGVRYTYTLDLKEPLVFEASSLEVSCSSSTEMHHKFGLVDVETEFLDRAQVARDDPEYWKCFREDPGLVVVKARKSVAAGA